MASLNSWLSPAVMDAMGWAILHSLWQGLGVAALAAALMALSRSSSVRYLIGVGALALMLAMPVATFVLLARPPVQAPLLARLSADLPADAKIPGTATQTPALAAPPVTMSPEPVFAEVARALPVAPANILPWLVAAWLCGVTLFGLRFAGGFLLLEHRRRRHCIAASPRIVALCQDVQRRLGVTLAIRYLECAWLEAPAVIGWFRPIILLPACALTGLTQDQLRAVIAHELAHIRRLDAFVNLFQILAETLLFYHPVLWWLNRRIRAEREQCCDEIAVSLTGDRLDYARALTSMAASKPAPVLAMAANRGPLSQRILHILGRKPFGAAQRIASLTIGGLFLIGALAAADMLLGIAYPVPAAQAKEAVREAVAETVRESVRAAQAARPEVGQAVTKVIAPARIAAAAIAAIPLPRPIELAQNDQKNDQNSQPEALTPPAPEIPAPVMTAQPQPASSAQVDAVDNVIVTAPRLRPEKALDNFIIAHARPSAALDKIARWRSGICPVTIGLPSKFNRYVTERIVRVAMTTGAPLDTNEPCRPNIIVLATAEPQALLDFIRAKRPGLLGFHYAPQRERLSKMRLPIQAWYSTATEDMRGLVTADLPTQTFVDVPPFSEFGMLASGGGGGSFGPRASSSSRLGDGLKSQFTTALLIVDTSKIAGQEIGPLSDYIAMLALSQGQYYDVCQDTPTITNLMASGCAPEMKPAALTDIDVTYLRGLYKMDAGASYRGQRASIAFQMKKALGGY